MACGVALLSRIDTNKSYTQALYVVDSPECARQVVITLAKLAAFTNVDIGIAVHQEKSFVTHFDHHVLVGTPKELAALRMFCVIDPKKLSMIVFDDATKSATSVYSKEHLLGAAPETCQIIFMSSFKTPTFDLKNIERIELFKSFQYLPPSVEHFFVNCPNEAKKYEFLEFLCAAADRNRIKEKILVFFEVKS